jgi:hypothetical protein
VKDLGDLVGGQEPVGGSGELRVSHRQQTTPNGTHPGGTDG